MVVQHAILVAVWHMFSNGVMHEDLGPDHFRTRDRERQKRHLIGRLRKLGVDVEVRADAA